MAETSSTRGDEWPPPGCVAVGEYAFEESLVPTPQQVEDAETFVFTRPEFLELSEEARRRSVIRLAIGAANGTKAVKEVGKGVDTILLFGGVVAVIESVPHEESVISTYYSLEEYETKKSK